MTNVQISQIAYLFAGDQSKHGLEFVKCQHELVTNLIPMKHLSTLPSDRVFDIIEVIQVKVKVGVAVNQYEKQSVTFKQLQVPESASAIAQGK